MLASAQGKNLNRYVPDYVLFDLETTGISCNCDEVIEISAVKVRSGTIADSFSSLVNPGRPIPWGASQVNNITDEMVSDAPTMEEILPVFLNFFGDDVLVGHNIERFDLKSWFGTAVPLRPGAGQRLCGYPALCPLPFGGAAHLPADGSGRALRPVHNGGPPGLERLPDESAGL